MVIQQAIRIILDLDMVNFTKMPIVVLSEFNRTHHEAYDRVRKCLPNVQ